MKSLKIWAANLLGVLLAVIGLLNILDMAPLKLLDYLDSPLVNFTLIVTGLFFITLSDYFSPTDSYQDYMTSLVSSLKK